MKHMICSQDNLGGLVYPFLQEVGDWQLVSHPLGPAESWENITQAPLPTLRWVKDGKVMDLHVTGMDTATFLAQTGLHLSLTKGGHVLSKRLSRIMRPYRYARLFPSEDVRIAYRPDWNSQVWDGAGWVSRAFVQRLANTLSLSDSHRHELCHTQRFEVTCLHEQGQDKGHVLVVDDLTTDFAFPAGSVKKELLLTNGHCFVGLMPIHSRDDMCLDIQSLINLYPFFAPETLLAWMEQESHLFVHHIRQGDVASILNRLYTYTSATDLAQLQQWHIGEYVMSGGHPMWFAGMVKGLAKQHLKRLGSRERKLRCPVAGGGRYYIFPDTVGNRSVPPGHITLDPSTATAWVNEGDWLTYIVSILGGCDGDDALWVFPFTDYDGVIKVLAWRSPNQMGEYILLQPTAESHAILWALAGGQTRTAPKMDSRLLPPRIDNLTYQYELNEETSDHQKADEAYSIASLSSTIQQAQANTGVLGMYCNLLLLSKALYGKLPMTLPASLEFVIDSAVKTGHDLQSIRQWVYQAAVAIVQQGKPIPTCLQERLQALLPTVWQTKMVTETSHWLESLTSAIDNHIAHYWAEVEALAMEACPPLEVFSQGRGWLTVGKSWCQRYRQVMRQMATIPEDALDREAQQEAVFAQARQVSETFLSQYPADHRACLLLGATAYVYAQGCQASGPVADGVLWQLGASLDSGGRSTGIAHAMLQALRGLRLLGEPVWTNQGAVVFFPPDSPSIASAGIPLQFNGVWVNWLRVVNKQTPSRMSQIPLAQRQMAKEKMVCFAEERFPYMTLTTHVTEDQRVVAYTEEGNLFGYVPRDQELLAIKHSQWRMVWSMALDGNIYAIVQPAL